MGASPLVIRTDLCHLIGLQYARTRLNFVHHTHCKAVRSVLSVFGAVRTQSNHRTLKKRF